MWKPRDRACRKDGPRPVARGVVGWLRRYLRRRPLPLGRQGERAIVRHLRRAGYRIVARNAWLGRYEVDIIARKGDTTAFVEVKTRRDTAVVLPEANVTHTKRQHLRKAARYYMTRENDPAMYYRFDVAAVLVPPQGKPTVTYYENAFPDA